MAIKPIKPSEAISLKLVQIPDEVIEAFNELIAENFSSGYSSFKQSDVVARIDKKIKESGGKLKFNISWLDVEEIYEKNGWKVEYDKPGYNESYPATFTFKSKKGS